ncbi:hypothetical protein D3C71_552380 [compost metagenome]
MKPIGSQRRAPFTLMPMCGMSTATSSSSEATKSQGAARSQVFIGTWKVSSAAMKAMTSEAACRVRKYEAL